jgi:GcrA cell cycle regulator
MFRPYTRPGNSEAWHADGLIPFARSKYKGDTSIFCNRWTDENTETLKRLWADGMSASKIAEALGNVVTRNAVIGKADRLGLARRDGANCSRASRKPKSKLKSVDPSRSESRREDAPVPPTDLPAHPFQHLTIEELDRHHCRWPEDNGAAITFCGAPTCERGHGVYCDHHAARAYVKTARQRAA